MIVELYKRTTNTTIKWIGFNLSWCSLKHWYLLPTIELIYWNDNKSNLFLNGSISINLVWLKLYIGFESLRITKENKD